MKYFGVVQRAPVAGKDEGRKLYHVGEHSDRAPFSLSLPGSSLLRSYQLVAFHKGFNLQCTAADLIAALAPASVMPIAAIAAAASVGRLVWCLKCLQDSLFDPHEGT